MDDVKERDRIRYQWMLNRIQTFKYLVITTILAMMAYTANSIDIINDFKALSLLCVASLLLLIALYIAGNDAGGALFYNEKSQEDVPKVSRVVMYTLIFISAVLIFTAKILNAITMISANTAIMG